MLELFLKLIDRCIELAKHRENANRRIYEELVNPTFADFEAVHKNYLETFLSYRKVLRDGKSKFNLDHPVLDQIIQDSLFSANLRSKLLELIRLESDSPYREFLSAIASYLGCAAAEAIYDEPDEKANLEKLVEKRIAFMGASCLPRLSLRESLASILTKPWDENVKKQKAITILDDLVAQIQKSYSHVLHEHNALRKKLLKHR